MNDLKTQGTIWLIKEFLKHYNPNYTYSLNQPMILTGQTVQVGTFT